MEAVHTLEGTAKDIETIARLRSWMEDEVRKEIGDFRKTKLFTEYDASTTLFSFKICFYR